MIKGFFLESIIGIFSKKRFDVEESEFIAPRIWQYTFSYNGRPITIIKLPDDIFWPDENIPRGAIPEWVRRALGVSKKEIRRQNKEWEDFKNRQNEGYATCFNRSANWQISGETLYFNTPTRKVVQSFSAIVDEAKRTVAALHRQFCGKDRI